MTIPARVKWDAQGSQSDPYSPVGQVGQATVNLKTDSRYYDLVMNADYFIVDGVRVEYMAIPFIRSMQSGTGIVEWICSTVLVSREIET